MRPGRRRIVVALSGLGASVLVATALWVTSPLMFRIPYAISVHEGWRAMGEQWGVFAYLNDTLPLLAWDPRVGLRTFDETFAEVPRDDDLRLGWLEWHRGSFGAAVRHLEKFHREHQESEFSRFWLALSYLRLAEADNCLAKLLDAGPGLGAHHARMCALPLAVFHEDERPARKAARAFEHLLAEYDPDSRVYQWLLNFAHMTVDGFPSEVPPELRIPEDGPLYRTFYGDEKRRIESKYAALRLRDRAPELGVDAFDAGRGVAVEDFDLDGCLDIVTGAYFSPLKLYRNKCDGTGFEDWSERSRLSRVKGTHIMTAADYDNDGRMDLFIARPVGSRNGDFVLLHNEADGTFSDVTVSAGLLPPEGERRAHPFTWGSAWGDVDNDGDLDLAVANWKFYNAFRREDVDAPLPGVVLKALLANASSALYLNDGDGTFTDATETYFGPRSEFARQNITGLAFGDYDRDGFADLAATTWFSTPGVILYHNERGRRFRPTDSLPETMWAFMNAFVDFDHDGLLDLFVGSVATVEGATRESVFGEGSEYSNWGNRFFEQTEAGSWVPRSVFSAMDGASMGVNFGDVNNDGAYDFYLGTGNPQGWMVLPSLFYMGAGPWQMDNISALHGLGTIQKGHGIVFFDFNDDGRADVYSSLGGIWPGDKWPNQLFVNESELSHTWLKVRLRGRRSNRFGVGAMITVVAERPAGERLVRTYHMDNKTGFGSAPYLAHIGLGDALRVVEVRVRWPGETRERSYSAELERLNVLDEGGGAALALRSGGQELPGHASGRSSR